MTRTWAGLTAAVVLLGCEGEPTNVRPAPQLVNVAAASRPENVLSVLVTASVEFADSVLVRYGVSGEALDSATPAVTTADGGLALPVFGLLPDTTYQLQIVAHGEGTTSSEPLQIRTGSLPVDLPRYQAGGPAPSSGYVLFAAGTYGLIIDNTGRVVWYVRFPNGTSLNFQANPNGRYAARPSAGGPADVAPLTEFDVLGNVTRSLDCARGLHIRFHDLLVEPDGGYWAMCDETRLMDLSAVGGLPDAMVTGTVLQHLDASGGLTFEWSSLDHFDITDLEEESRSAPNVNFTHGNALDLDRDGNLLVSFRSLNEITKIDTRTGQVLWRMGGLRNEFTFEGPEPPFLRQHGVRVAANGDLILLDNLGEEAGSRAERYVVDEATRTAHLAAAYAPALATRGFLGGSTQDLPDNRILVSLGDGGVVQEYNGDGTVVWEMQGQLGYIFRAQRIYSLYHPEVGLTR